MRRKFITNTAEETFAEGSRFAKGLSAGDVVALSGELGSGKTLFTQGISESLGVKDVVNSPTFKLIGEYDSTPPLYHFDFYRLESAEEAVALGIEHYFFGEGISVVEWADLFPQLIPVDAIQVLIKIRGERSREILVERRIAETAGG
ncbi:MAG: tRNA (adenosine(37)-N6)-threonylcarbamoyltransferase complex ATPase subunit type 1 TsaE [Candidatus Neomarinimicrobiota bacterium]|nr:tRNA (adenosine(37)-N6)-threonylcarbamoyltransferase complex ATPase subunit type 1 TsaE [Candidatus Neomarinimicrobiota bacterium]